MKGLTFFKLNMRATIATTEEVDGCQRKIAWFNHTPNGIYFEAGQFFMGSHTSYHVDGNVFRTSPATLDRPRFQGRYLPLNNFKGWYQAGVSMIMTKAIHDNSCVKARDRKRGNYLGQVSLAQINNETINIVIEFLDIDKREWLNNSGIAPPECSISHIIKFDKVLVIVTLLVTENELLVKPQQDGFAVSHQNSRFSLNQKNVEYSYEAYGQH